MLGSILFVIASVWVPAMYITVSTNVPPDLGKAIPLENQEWHSNGESELPPELLTFLRQAAASDRVGSSHVQDIPDQELKRGVLGIWFAKMETFSDGIDGAQKYPCLVSEIADIQSHGNRIRIRVLAWKTEQGIMGIITSEGSEFAKSQSLSIRIIGSTLRVIDHRSDGTDSKLFGGLSFRLTDLRKGYEEHVAARFNLPLSQVDSQFSDDSIGGLD